MYVGQFSLKNMTLWGWTELRLYSFSVALDIKGGLEQKFVQQQMLFLIHISSFSFTVCRRLLLFLYEMKSVTWHISCLKPLLWCQNIWDMLCVQAVADNLKHNSSESSGQRRLLQTAHRRMWREGQVNFTHRKVKVRGCRRVSWGAAEVYPNKRIHISK